MSDNKETPRNAGAQQSARNAGVRQTHRHVDIEERAAFDNIGLSKRNADYMFRFNRELQKQRLSPDHKAGVIKRMVTELTAGQKEGKTAKAMYGDVDEHIKRVVEGPKVEQKLIGGIGYWPNVLYNALTFFMIFNLMFGLMYTFSPNLMKTSKPVGVTAIAVSAIVAGFLLPMMPKLLDTHIKHRFNLFFRTIAVVLGFGVWMGLFYVSENLTVFNPVLPAMWSIVLGVLSIGGMFLVRRFFKIEGGFFGQS
ncbi:hypothetical protein FD13_GL001235 [Levilactobacillus senmaizukei DSM 21775 = NBRC 103853]|uniref:Integral membrane protein n=1 Tax=Levilactobacillus senmaizukei DSM 21775 = NBRC 103853 TaxID=1423803 RepID=A0A0R2DQ53_9LACO|nr:DUF1129 family protein [Levilactobacillus senmaizukei]KRN02919.1 hypothetical protein FD13_GL001235 [Levilactobacillus senmaizukei DSM 21775 = NBRC 103853]